MQNLDICLTAIMKEFYPNGYQFFPKDGSKLNLSQKELEDLAKTINKQTTPHRMALCLKNIKGFKDWEKDFGYYHLESQLMSQSTALSINEEPPYINFFTETILHNKQSVYSKVGKSIKNICNINISNNGIVFKLK